MDDLMDDDFGDIYADVEVQASSAINSISSFPNLYVKGEEEYKYNNDADPVDASPNEESLRSVFKSSDSICEKSWHSESDSDDDLNIVLNDEDCKAFSVAPQRNENRDSFDEDEDAFFCVKNAYGKNELNPCANGHGDERGNGVNDCYDSQYQRKQLKQYGSLFPNNKKVNESVGVTSSSSKARGDWDDNGCVQHEILNSGQLTSICATANSVAYHSGYGFFLPWYRTILDVNIDAFEEKRWRYHGVDISNFFNFGFNEDSWKQYCISLEQLRQHSYIHSRFPNHEFSKLTKACEIGSERERSAEGISQAASSSKFAYMGERLLRLPKGRAIQVEDGTGERQPTMDVRRPRIRDSGVVIQINVQDSNENSSGSGEEELRHIYNGVEASKIRDLDVNDKKDDHDSGSSNADESLGESLEDIKSSSMNRFPQAISESSQMAPDPDDHDKDHKENAETSEAIAEAIDTAQKAEEENGGNTCKSDQCLTETELSVGDRSHFSLTLSCTGSDSEASLDSVHSMPQVSHKFLNRQSSGAMLLEPDASECKSPKSNVATGNPDKRKHYSRRGSAIWEGRRHQSGRFHKVAEGSILPDADSDASPLFGDRLSFDREIERLQDFGYHNRDNISYDWEENFSGFYGGKKFAKNHVQDLCMKPARRRYHQSLRHKVEPEDRRIWIEENFPERYIRLDDRDDMNRDWDCGGSGLSPGSMIPVTYKNSRRLISKYNNFKQTDIRWRRKCDKIEYGKQTNADVCLFDHKNVDHDIQHKNRRSILYNLKRESFSEKRIPSVGREAYLCGRRVRYGFSPPKNLENPWCMEIEDEQCDLDYQHISFWSHREPYAANKERWKNKITPRNDMFDPRLAERFEGCGREISIDKYRDSDLVESCYDIDNAEGDIVYTNDWAHQGRRKYNWQSGILHKMESESILRLQDYEYYAKGSSCSYEKSSRHERFCASHRSANVCKVDDVQMERHRYKVFKGETSAGFFNRKPNMMFRGEHDRTTRRCDDPVDLICGEGKSSGRCFNAANLMANGKFETMDLKFVEEQKVSKDFNGTQTRKATQHSISKIEGCKDEEKWLHKFRIREQKEDLDVEEGQIVPQEPIGEDRLKKKHASESVATMQNMKKRTRENVKRTRENVSCGNEVDNGYDDEQRILDTLAKMERRRQRFKDPIALKKKPDLTLKLQNDLIADTAENKQERPARKRRWGGS